MLRGPWFALDDSYVRYYAAARGGSAVAGQTPTQKPAWMRRERQERGEMWARTKNLLVGVDMIRYMPRADATGGDPRGAAGSHTRLLQRTGGEP